MASHNLMRVRARPGVNPGWLYLSLAASQVQAQVKAGAFGSVVDVVDPDGLDTVVLPPPAHGSQGDDALICWQDFAEASRLEDLAVRRLEAEILQRTGALVYGSTAMGGVRDGISD